MQTSTTVEEAPVTINPNLETVTPVANVPTDAPTPSPAPAETCLAVACVPKAEIVPVKPQRVLFNHDHDITNFASEDTSRYVLNGIHYDAKAKVMVATDGRRMIKVPVKTVDVNELASCMGQLNGGFNEPEDCIIPVEAFKRALKSLPKSTSLPILGNVVLSKNCAPNTAILSTTDLDTTQDLKVTCVDGNYPNYRQVFPTEPPKFTIAVNPDYLRDIADYAKKNALESNPSIVLEFWDNLSPLQFKVRTASGEAVGLLMPMRLA